LPIAFLGSAPPCMREEGDACEVGVFRDLGFGFFLASRLPRCSLLAIAMPFLGCLHQSHCVQQSDEQNRPRHLRLNLCLAVFARLGYRKQAGRITALAAASGQFAELCLQGVLLFAQGFRVVCNIGSPTIKNEIDSTLTFRCL
jgi:hypothetical protein